MIFFNTRRQKRRRLLNEICSWVIPILIVILFAYVVITFGVQTTKMLGQSMEPVLKDQDTVLINKVSYQLKQPKRYDIVVFQSNMNNSNHYYIKRIVGLPGETIQIQDGEIYINNKKLEDTPFKELITTAGLAAEPLEIGEEEYFVLGDNCNNSEDSRFANIGNINKTDLIGKISFRILPFKQFGNIK